MVCHSFTFTSAGLTLKEVKKIIKEARSQWLDLGIELEIDMTTLMVSTINFSDTKSNYKLRLDTLIIKYNIF